MGGRLNEWVNEFLNPVEVSVVLVHFCPVYWRVYIARFRNVIHLLDQLPFIEVGSLVNTWFPYCQSHLCFLVEKCRKYVWVEEGKNCIQCDFIFHDAKAGKSYLPKSVVQTCWYPPDPPWITIPEAWTMPPPTEQRAVLLHSRCCWQLSALACQHQGSLLAQSPWGLEGPINRWGGLNTMLRAEAQGGGTACISRCWNVPEKCSDKMRGCRQRPRL